MRLIAQHELTAEQIMQVAEVSRQTVFSYRDTVVERGVAALLQGKWAPGRRPTVRGPVAEELIARLEAGQFRQARDAQSWIKKAHAEGAVGERDAPVVTPAGRQAEGAAQSPRQKDPAKAKAFKAELSMRLTELAGPAPAQSVRLWVLDVHRYGLLPVIRRVRARRTVRRTVPTPITNA